MESLRDEGQKDEPGQNLWRGLEDGVDFKEERQNELTLPLSMDVPRYTYTSASNKISIVNSELNQKKLEFERVYLRFQENYAKYGKYSHTFVPKPVKPFIL